MLERLLIDRLLTWRVKASRKPVLLDGLRQVGKSYLLATLFGAQHFRAVHRLDFVASPEYQRLFEGSLEPFFCHKEVPSHVVSFTWILSTRRFWLVPVYTVIIIFTRVTECRFVLCMKNIQLSSGG